MAQESLPAIDSFFVFKNLEFLFIVESRNSEGTYTLRRKRMKYDYLTQNWKLVPGDYPLSCHITLAEEIERHKKEYNTIDG